MAVRQSDATINVRRDVTMFHTVLCVGHDKTYVAVAIVTDPTRHDHLAQVVMHKTRSHGVAVQVARYVRRRFGIEEPVQTVRATRPVEAMIGYACAGGFQHPPSSYPSEIFEAVRHIASTPVADLLREVADGHNAARTRYVVYEVRGSDGSRRRGTTHRYNALERRYREAPPDTVPGADLVMISRHADSNEAMTACGDVARAGDHLWTRKPSPDYVRRHLHIDHSPQPPHRHGVHDILWTCDDSPAVRVYDFPAVVIGPHVYTEHQIRHVLEHGEWPPDGRSREGRRLLAQKT